MHIEKEFSSAFGHVCSGTTAEIKNSPINIHIHIHANEVTIGQKIGRAVSGLLKRERHRAIEGAAQLSKDELQGRLVRELQSGRCDSDFREIDNSSI